MTMVFCAVDYGVDEVSARDDALALAAESLDAGVQPVTCLVCVDLDKAAKLIVELAEYLSTAKPGCDDFSVYMYGRTMPKGPGDDE